MENDVEARWDEAYCFSVVWYLCVCLMEELALEHVNMLNEWREVRVGVDGVIEKWCENEGEYGVCAIFCLQVEV